MLSRIHLNLPIKLSWFGPLPGDGGEKPWAVLSKVIPEGLHYSCCRHLDDWWFLSLLWSSQGSQRLQTVIAPLWCRYHCPCILGKWLSPSIWCEVWCDSTALLLWGYSHLPSAWLNSAQVQSPSSSCLKFCFVPSLLMLITGLAITVYIDNQ